MKRTLLTISIGLMCIIIHAQVPQGFNYQAIARDGSGNPITNTSLPVTITIQSDSLDGTIFWQEYHPDIETNDFGMFSLMIGKGVRQPASTAPTFSDINWALTPKFIKTEIFYESELKNMGSSRLWSVPYSMVARELDGSLSKLAVTGTTESLEESLFEVKNKDGQTIFAVYNEGVRIWVDDGDAKGRKGGFSIGGFGDSKAPSREILFVSTDSIRAYIHDDPSMTGIKGGFSVRGYDNSNALTSDFLIINKDSTRIYINNEPSTKGRKGGFSIGGFGVDKGEESSYLDVSADATGIVLPAQNRILWYPLKNAFLAGNIIIEHPDSVGTNSFSTGYQSRAKGIFSQAMGYQAAARGNYSTSIGLNSVTKGNNAFAFGNQAKAFGTDSYAFGTGAKATGVQSFAFGSVGVDSIGAATGNTVASGQAAFALGFGSVASAPGAFTFGVNDSASAVFALAMGYGTKARGVFSTTMGGGNIVESAGWFGTATGFWTKAGNWASASFGDQTYAKGHTSFATGFKTHANGQLSSTFGDQTTTNGYGSIAMGYHTTADGIGSIAMGEQTTAKAYASLVLGRYNLISGTTTVWNPVDPVFVIGNGESTSARSNALTVYKNGKADLGSSINLNSLSTGGALFVNGDQALWYDDTYFSWGYGGSYNYFADMVTIGTPSDMGYKFYVAGTSYSTGGWASSDLRWKKNLQPLDNELPGLLQLNGYKYNWRSDEFPDMNFENEKQIGLIAQDVEKVFPELVRTDNNGYKAVSYEKLTVFLLEGMKEQQEQIEAVKKENAELSSELSELKALVNRLITNQ